MMRTLVLLLVAGIAFAQELPRAKPEEVGLDPGKLAAIGAAIQAHVDNKEISGSVTLIARRGKVAYFKAHGLREVAGNKPMQLDTIFRIYSMSKPVTSVAAMLLVEQGKLKLDDPVSRYLPEFKGLKVQGAQEPAQPEMTVRDLMRHTSGLTYGFAANTPADQAFRKADVLSRNGTLKDMVAKLGKLPLAYAPNTRWNYSVSTDVLGRIVEVVSKTPLDVFFQQKIFAPLGMQDTGFFVPKDKLDRFAANYGPGLRPNDVPATSRFAQPTAMFSGGGGLVSTTRDYALFCLMLASKGRGLLKPETVAEMTRNQLSDALMPIGFGPFKMRGVGFGLGFSIRIENGEFGWGGAASTTFWIAPKEDLIFINMIQRMPRWGTMGNELRPLVYAAVTSP